MHASAWIAIRSQGFHSCRRLLKSIAPSRRKAPAGFSAWVIGLWVFDYVNRWKATIIIHNRISWHSAALVCRSVLGVGAQSRHEVDCGVYSSSPTTCRPSVLPHRPPRASHLLSVRSWSRWQYCTCQRWCFVARSQHYQPVSVPLRQLFHRLREYWMFIN